MKTLGSKGGLAGALAFLLPFLSLVTLWGVSLCSFVFFLAALYHFRACRTALAHHWLEVRWVVAGFFLFALFSVFALVVHPEARSGSIEKPVRMFLGISALALVLAFKPDRKYLWWGVAGGAALGAMLVGYQRFALDTDRPHGLTNAIVTGDILLCFGLVALAAALDMRGRHNSAWAALGAVAGFAGSLITGTRGGWVALMLAAILFVLYGRRMLSGPVRLLVLASFALVAGTFAVPQSGMHERVRQGVKDVTTYFDGVNAYSNIGIRLELWRGAGLLLAERPLLGIDRAGAQREMARYVQEGELNAVVLPAEHFHNDALQVLVTGGAFGFIAWLAILVTPLVFFARQLRRRAGAGRGHFAAALAGMLVVVSYFSFGLTEVIFWSVKASLLYTLMVFVLMGLCLNAKDEDGRQGDGRQGDGKQGDGK